MGKTKLFSRPNSKSSQRLGGADEYSELPMHQKSYDTRHEISSRPRNNHDSSRYSEEKLKRRKQIDKAKQLADNKNSLKRRKKHETVKTMAQNIPRERDYLSGDEKGNSKSFVFCCCKYS